MIIAVRVGLELGAAKKMVIHIICTFQGVFQILDIAYRLCYAHSVASFSPYGIYKFLLPFKIVKLLSHFLPLTVFIA